MTKTNTVSQISFQYIDYKVGESQNKSKAPLSETHYDI